MFPVVVYLWAAVSPGGASEADDCDALYYGEGRPKDDARAFACYRSSGDWAMVAIMQLNGEGTPVDVAGARATFQKMLDPGGSMGFDAAGLDRILKQREANPGAPGARIDFCRDVRGGPRFGYCAFREEKSTKVKDDRRLVEVRAGLERRSRPLFDAAREAFGSYLDAERERVQQKYIDRPDRREAFITEEVFVRSNFMARVEALGRSAGPVRGPRSVVEVERALEAAYRDDLRRYVSIHDPLKQIKNPMGCALVDANGIQSPCDRGEPYRTDVHDYQARSRTAQRLWVRYRDAMARLAATHRPGTPGIGDLTRVLVTEDRIHELTPAEVEGR